jgi:hypothetical protein
MVSLVRKRLDATSWTVAQDSLPLSVYDVIIAKSCWALISSNGSSNTKIVFVRKHWVCDIGHHHHPSSIISRIRLCIDEDYG